MTTAVLGPADQLDPRRPVQLVLDRSPRGVGYRHDQRATVDQRHHPPFEELADDVDHENDGHEPPVRRELHRGNPHREDESGDGLRRVVAIKKNLLCAHHAHRRSRSWGPSPRGGEECPLGKFTSCYRQ